MKTEADNSHIILFDGVCNFCNYWIGFIIKHDKESIFKFAPLQSEKGKQILNKLNLNEILYDSIIMISKDTVHKKSSAVFEIIKHLKGFIRIFILFKYLPQALTDFIYDVLAKSRYNLFGKRKNCRIPASDEIERFL